MFDGLVPPSNVASRLELDSLDPINQGLIRWWPLNESGGSTANDISRFKKTGSLIGTTNRGITKAGRSVLLGGSGQHISSNAPALPSLGGISISAWVKLTATGSPHTILSSFQSSVNEVVLILETSGNQYQFWGSLSSASAASSTFPSIFGRLAFLTVTLNSNTLAASYYVDGINVGGANPAAGISSGNTGFYIGNFYRYSMWYLNGQVSGVRIYDRVLAPAEIKRLYRDPWAGATDPLARLFSFPRLTQTIHDLAATSINSGVPSIGTPTFSQTHSLTPTGIATSTPTVGSPTLVQIHSLSAAGITTTPIVGNPALTQIHALSGQSINTGTPVFGAPILDAQISTARTLVLPDRDRVITLSSRSREVILVERN